MADKTENNIAIVESPKRAVEKIICLINLMQQSRVKNYFQ